jgi:predicted amidophosphoribosyltransferase
LRNAIAARPCRLPVIAGRRVLLIDDVLTSGATATICTRALLDAGAANIDVLVASRVADPRRRLPASTHTDPDEDHADH